MAFRMVPALGLALALLAMPAEAQQRPACGDRSDLLAQLKDKYQETPTGFGMTGQGSVVELITSEQGTWTLVLTYPNGRSCLMATGEGWELWRARLAGKGA
ncbi:MAG: hypothetical protein IT562_11170 [Alphaproteobacteria bacterium]|nr:hypothetical protein [Alphaproteobacteria bacterium]